MYILLKDGSKMEVQEGITIYEIAKKISNGLARVAVAGEVNGELQDLRYVVTKDNLNINIVTYNDVLGKKVFWHTASHIMAQAVKRLFPQVKLAIGPAIDSGFYYDFDINGTFSTDDLLKIEEEMKKIAKEELKIEKFLLSKSEAMELMKDEPYKLELINELNDGEISFYKQGEYIDLCSGPHLMSTGEVKAIKLLSSSGAYWRGNEKNKMLQRIYGVSYAKTSELEEHITKLEDARKRDHNKLGRDLELFTTVDYIGQGLPIMLPKGAKVIQILQRFVEDEEERRGYLLTKTPFMAKRDLYKISGHWDHYRDGMFIMGNPDDDGKEVFALRPMTCPFQFMAYKNKQRSYRDLPLRYNETSTLFRNEDSGEMHGLIRLRQFTISEGHLAVRIDQLEEEVRGCVELAEYFSNILGLKEDFSYRFSKWDPNNKEKYIGSEENWNHSQAVLKSILDNLKIDYVEAEGEAAFYGPKLDIQCKNVWGKEDTIITIQVDFELAHKFDMTYVDSNGEKQYPVIIHRTSLGCYERTLALLIEKYAGALPTWLSPTQITILPITNSQEDYAIELKKKLCAYGFRVELDNRNEKIGYRIREAQLNKIPYMLIIGDKEIADNVVAVRSRKNGDLGQMKIEDFILKIKNEVENFEK